MPKTKAASSASDKSASSPRNRKANTTKDKNKPKRPTSAFFYFLAEKREEIKCSHPEMPVTEVSKKAGQMWKECEDKAKWEKMAEKDKERYKKEMEKYEKSEK